MSLKSVYNEASFNEGRHYKVCLSLLCHMFHEAVMKLVACRIAASSMMVKHIGC